MTPKVPGLAVLLLLAACGAFPPDPRQQVAAATAPVVSAVSGAATDPPAAAPAEALRFASPRTEIAAMEQMLATTAKGSPDRPRLLRRLAETYVNLEAAAGRDGGKNGEATVQAARRKAIEHYTTLASEYPSWCAGGGRGCGDEVLFYLAHEHEQAHEPDQAQKAYREIIKSWPASRYVPNAYLAFAEVYFEEAGRDPGKLALAERAYLRARGVTRIACCSDSTSRPSRRGGR